MKKVKLVLWLAVLGLIALVVYQNLKFLMTPQKIEVNLWIQQYSAELNIGVILLGLFLAGLLVSYFLSLAQRFRTRKTIRKLNEALDAERKKVADLESRLGGKEAGSSTSAPSAPPASADASASSGQGQQS
ncbi:MAG: DUF1049 domain-containing protein [Desulfobacterales bacterium]|nr:DUF1049 domain-containing protein [Desulfobacterales bacterium]